ncbi:MAG: hypothetical protein RI580_13190 [Halothece sp. Uz-M2-17]|nr:hypothetical protein [Halothece sp. Uz-M2-17]
MRLQDLLKKGNNALTAYMTLIDLHPPLDCTGVDSLSEDQLEALFSDSTNIKKMRFTAPKIMNPTSSPQEQVQEKALLTLFLLLMTSVATQT